VDEVTLTKFAPLVLPVVLVISGNWWRHQGAKCWQFKWAASHDVNYPMCMHVCLFVSICIAVHAQ